ncbi:MAG: hypothetical protein R6U04_11220 [Bacteroidales bacterium]
MFFVSAITSLLPYLLFFGVFTTFFLCNPEKVSDLSVLQSLKFDQQRNNHKSISGEADTFFLYAKELKKKNDIEDDKADRYFHPRHISLTFYAQKSQYFYYNYTVRSILFYYSYFSLRAPPIM